MARRVRLRPWQKTALDRLAARAGRDFLAVATPGAGKTTFALVAVRQALAAAPERRVVVVAPTEHLKYQWAAAAAAFDLALDPSWSPRTRLPADLHGIVTTYQQVAASARAVGALAADAVVVLDELHHAGDERAWGDAVRSAFGGAALRLALSGTPFRSDTRAIPFVHYEGDEARPDFEYGYGDALGDGRVVRPVYFPRLGGSMEWVGSDGTQQAATFADPLAAERAAQRLRTALSADGEWLPEVLRRADAQLRALRRDQPDAGGLAIASDQEHARAIARLLRDRCGSEAVVATSDDAGATRRIAAFATSDAPWIVAVRMVSEGVDIPRLRVGVFATTTTTELFFRQAVGRLVRWQAGVRRQRAYLFLPDDARLRALAGGVAEHRRHVLRRREGDAVEDEREAAGREVSEQLSLFAALSAVPEGPPHEAAPDDGDPDEAGERHPAEADDGRVLLDLAPAPRRGGAVALAGDWSGGAAVPAPFERERLRDLNADIVRSLARLSGRTHAQVNGELNRLAGLASVGEATVLQLQRRLACGERLLERARGPLQPRTGYVVH